MNNQFVRLFAFVQAKLTQISSNRAIFWLVIALAAIAINIAQQFLPNQLRVPGDEWLRDLALQFRVVHQPEQRLTLIDIDDTSIAQLGPMPWPRTRMADLLEILLTDYQVKGIALDIVFETKKEAEGDLRLTTLAEHGPIVLAQAFDFIPNRELALASGHLLGGFHSPFLTSAHATGYIANHAGFNQAKYAGNIGFIPDFDGILRRLPVSTEYQNTYYPGLALALFNCCADKQLRGKLKPEHFFVANTGLSRVEFSRDYASYQVIPAYMVLNGSAPLEKLNGRLIIIGSSGFSLADRVPTPLDASTNGFLVHAQALSSILDRAEGLEISAWPGKIYAIIFSLLTISLAIYMFPRFSAWANLATLILLLLIWLVCAYLVMPHDAEFAPTGPAFSLLFLLVSAVPFSWQSTQRKSRRLLGTLQQYVARAVVDELLRRDLKDPLAPCRHHVTTLIADMEGYTSQVENMAMEQAAQLTKEFLECLTLPVLNRGGTLDKYTGDGLVAFWGAPLPVDDHADLAVDAAIAIAKNVAKLSAEYQKRGRKKIRVRIGIESGLAIAGDFGSSQRSIYTAVGDSVNTASRLEDVARLYPHDIIIGQGTVSYAQRHEFIELGEKLLKGKEKPTRIYTVEFSL